MKNFQVSELPSWCSSTKRFMNSYDRSEGSWFVCKGNGLSFLSTTKERSLVFMKVCTKKNETYKASLASCTYVGH